MNEDDINATIVKLRTASSYLMQAIEKARKDNPGTVIKLMIATENPDKSGKIIARMDSVEFIEDVAMIVGFKEPTVDESATFFMKYHGLTVIRDSQPDRRAGPAWKAVSSFRKEGVGFKPSAIRQILRLNLFTWSAS